MSIIEKIKADDIKVVSFDIFDTLLTRNTLKPEDIFYLMQKQDKLPEDFKEKRIIAEKTAREKSSSGEVTLEDIYKQYAISNKLNDCDKKDYMKTELDFEASSLSARKEGMILFNEAVNAGKEIIFLSDMYLPSTFIAEQLKKNGYTYSGKLYLSCELGASKHNMFLYKVLKKDGIKRGIRPEEILHIGDNYISDYQNAKASGLCAEWLPLKGKEEHMHSGLKVRVKKLLINLHLFGTAKKMKYFAQRMGRFFSDTRYRKQNEFDIEIKSALKEADKAMQGTGLAKVLVAGDIADFDKGTCRYVNTLNENCNNSSFILLNEAVWMPTEKVNEKISFTVLQAPKFMAKNKYPRKVKAELSTEQVMMLANNTVLQEIAVNIQGHFEGTEKVTSEMLVCGAYSFFEQLLDMLNPKVVLIWNQFQPMHRILSEAAKSRNIRTVYMEFGCLPGTFALEEGGQMGESAVTLQWEEFYGLEVDESQMQHAESVLEYLRKTGRNRNEQPAENGLDNIENKLKKNRPTLLYAGQNDFESGMFPYTERAAKYHSPSFASSLDALEYLANIAEKNSWNIIYKPHPMMVEMSRKSLPKNVVFAENTDINKLIDICNVTITILSQVAYISLIRQKPLVLLGFCQLKGKGCCYETYVKSHIEKNINKALGEEITEQQKKNFVKHTAQLTQYYLYDDLSGKDICYGRSFEEAIKYFDEIVKE